MNRDLLGRFAALSTSRVSELLSSAFVLMVGALAVTGFVAWELGKHVATMAGIFSSGWIWAIFVLQLVLVFVIAACKKESNAGILGFFFAAYAALNGVLLSSIFAAHPVGNIVAAFGVTAGTFGAFSLYGFVTKRDLTNIGSFCIMALLGIIIAMIVNAFIGSHFMDYLISCITVIIFVCLTAYDTQKLKEIASAADSEENLGITSRYAIQGALELYLDFINLFLHILRLMTGKGGSSND